jgi:hypothetical protein
MQAFHVKKIFSSVLAFKLYRKEDQGRLNLVILLAGLAVLCIYLLWDYLSQMLGMEGMASKKPKKTKKPKKVSKKPKKASKKPNMAATTPTARLPTTEPEVIEVQKKIGMTIGKLNGLNVDELNNLIQPITNELLQSLYNTDTKWSELDSDQKKDIYNRVLTGEYAYGLHPDIFIRG